jgi:hypothetical protein
MRNRQIGMLIAAAALLIFGRRAQRAKPASSV